MSLHRDIMNLPSTLDPRDSGPYANGYGHGYDATRHGAAVLAAPYDALVEQMAQALKAQAEAERLGLREAGMGAFNRAKALRDAALAKHAEVTGK